MLLESPGLPVLEGATVTLRCRDETNSSDLRFDFFKDGVPVSINSTGVMIIHSASKSDEGLYKCRIHEGEESLSNWLAVGGEKTLMFTLTVHFITMFTRVCVCSQLLFHLHLRLNLPVPLPGWFVTWWWELLTCCPPSYWDSYTETGREVGTVTLRVSSSDQALKNRTVRPRCFWFPERLVLH